MAKLLISDDSVTVSLSSVEKVEALHGNVTVSRSSITAVSAVPDGLAEVHGLSAPGTRLQGVIMVGTWKHRDGITFAVCHGERPAVVVDLVGEGYDRLVVTVDDAEEVARSLTPSGAGSNTT